MEILYLPIPLSLVLLGAVVWALLWAVRSGQFENLEGPAYRVLTDDHEPKRNGGNAPENGDERQAVSARARSSAIGLR